MRCPASTSSGVPIVLPTAAADFGNAVPGANSATIAPTRGANKTFRVLHVPVKREAHAVAERHLRGRRRDAGPP